MRAFALTSPAVRDLDEKTRQSTRVAVVVLLRERQADGSEAWRPILDVMNAAWLDAQLAPTALGRLSRVPPPKPLVDPSATEPASAAEAEDEAQAGRVARAW